MNVDKNLLFALKQGDEKAFGQLYTTWSKSISRFAYQMTKSVETAEEITHDVLLTVWANRQQVDPERDVTAWVKTIARNRVLNHLKKMALDRRLQEQVYEQMKSIRNGSADESCLYQELNQLVNQSKFLLSNQQRAVYSLGKEQHHSYKEIAEKLGISVNTVRLHMIAALARIRGYIDAKTFTITIGLLLIKQLF